MSVPVRGPNPMPYTYHVILNAWLPEATNNPNNLLSTSTTTPTTLQQFGHSKLSKWIILVVHGLHGTKKRVITWSTSFFIIYLYVWCNLVSIPLNRHLAIEVNIRIVSINPSRPQNTNARQDGFYSKCFATELLSWLTVHRIFLERNSSGFLCVSVSSSCLHVDIRLTLRNVDIG